MADPKERVRKSDPFATRKPTLLELTDSMIESVPEVIERVIEVPPSVMPFEDGKIAFGKVAITRVGLEFYNDLTPEEWEAFGKSINQMSSAIQWVIGDWLAYGDIRWGVDYDHAAKLVGRSKGTIYNWASICANIDFSRRREKLHFSHHVEVAPLPVEQQEFFLGYADKQERLSVSKFRAYIDEQLGRTPPTLSKSPLANRKNKRAFTRVWSALSKSGGVGVKKEDVDQLRKWLDEIEKSLG